MVSNSVGDLEHRNNMVFNSGVVDDSEILSWHSLKLGLGLSLDIRLLVVLFRIGVYALCTVAAQGFRRPKANKKMRPFLN